MFNTRTPLKYVLMMTLVMLPSEKVLIAKTPITNGPIPRPEHPKPQFQRDTWLNLNGQWNFAFDFDLSGIEKGWPSKPSEGIRNIQREWREVVIRDLNHTSIIAWTPFNETGDGARIDFEAHRRAIQETIDLTRALDPTRPVHDSSGHSHVDTDIYSVHDYEQDLDKFRQHYALLDPAQPDSIYRNDPGITAAYKGQPYIVAEYGGTYWTDEHPRKEPVDKGSRLDKWGYGKNTKLFMDHLETLTTIMTNNPNVAGFCYAQLYDIEQEQNGIYTYDRKLKFNVERLRKIFRASAKIEE